MGRSVLTKTNGEERPLNGEIVIVRAKETVQERKEESTKKSRERRKNIYQSKIKNNEYC